MQRHPVSFQGEDGRQSRMRAEFREEWTEKERSKQASKQDEGVNENWVY